MKKIFALALALIMVLCMSTTALAETITTEEDETNAGSATIDVYGFKTENAGEDVTIISADIVADSMIFAYVTNSDKGVWNPADHTYGAAITNAEWIAEQDGNTLTVTNHSNAAITVDVSIDMSTEGGAALTGTWDIATTDLEAGVENEYANADNETFTLTVAGDPGTLLDDGNTNVIGTITVAIKEKTA